MEGDGVLGAVRCHDGDDLALRQASLEPAAGLPSHGGVQLGVAQPVAGRAVDERGLVRSFLGALEHVRGER